jgi:hypothetical protein
MLNFAERTGSGAVMLVWSFPKLVVPTTFINQIELANFNHQQQTTTNNNALLAPCIRVEQ